MKNIISNILDESLRVKSECIQANIDNILAGADRIARCLADGHKLMIFGNGGSAADAQHVAAEFVNRFRIERPPLAAIALTTDSSILTSIGNDYHFDDIFSKQVEALGQKADIAMGISTSGNSPNVLKAMKAAENIGIFTIGLTGTGGEMVRHSDLLFTVPSSTTARIQESHITLCHILCELVDRILFPRKF